MAVPTVTVSGTALSVDAAGTPIAANLTGGVAGDIAVVFIALDQASPATITANGAGWTKRVDVTSFDLAWPTDATTGIQGASLTTVTLSGTLWRASTDGVALAHTSEVIGGQTYAVYTQYDFVATTQFVYLDVPYIKFVRCRFACSGTVNNTSAMVQGPVELSAVIFEDCSFDGGATAHNRGVQSDHGDITVRRCNFQRCGNAAVEKNDTSGLSSLDVSDSYITEVKGWPPSEHVDGLQIGAGRNFTARHNTIWIQPYNGADGDTANVSNSCIGCWAELGHVTGDVLITDNQMSGGGSIMYVEQKAGFLFQGTVTVSNNRFIRDHFASLQGAQYNPTTGHAAVWFVLAPPGRPASLSGAGTGWTGNTWENGVIVTLAEAITST